MYSSIQSHSREKTVRLNGLKNFGNTCLLNRLWLLEYLRKETYLKNNNTNISSTKQSLKRLRRWFKNYDLKDISQSCKCCDNSKWDPNIRSSLYGICTTGVVFTLFTREFLREIG